MVDLQEVARTVVRIPVAGPSPNNTLVFVTARFNGVIPGGPGRGQGICATAYEIAGFDQTRAADYLAHTQFSMTFTMNYISLTDDQSFTAAVDTIQGHIASDGKIYATGDLVLGLEDGTITVNFGLSAYILTQEPQPDFTRPPRRVPSVRDMIQKRPSYLQEQGLRAVGKTTLETAPRKPMRIIDECR